MENNGRFYWDFSNNGNNMIYKVMSNKLELEQVEKLCSKHNLNASSSGFTLIAVDNNTVVGAITLKNVPMIEPLVSDNPVVASKLFNLMEGVILSRGIQVVRCNTDKKNEKAFTKAGFNRVFDDNIILEKIYEVE